MTGAEGPIRSTVPAGPGPNRSTPLPPTTRATPASRLGMVRAHCPDRWQAPEPDHPERRALPGHLVPAAVALFDDLPARLPGAVVDGAMARLTAGAATLAPEVELLVDAFRVRAAATCPATAVPDPEEAFAWTPATAARTLGLRAVAHHLRGDSGATPIEEAVDDVVADLMADGGDRSPGPWLTQLTPPARAVALSHARRWAEQAVAWLPLRLVGRRELRFLDDDWWRPGTHKRGDPGPGLVVHGRRDITVAVEGRRVAVTVAGGSASGPGLAEVDALTALAGLLCDPRGRLVRVVRVHPASGEVVSVNVTAALVERAVGVVLATAAVLAQAEPAVTPGPGCTWCPRRAACAAGTSWLERPDRRSMGLPLLAYEA